MDILLEVSMMSMYLVLPRQGRLEQVIHIFGYLKTHNKLMLLFDSNHPQISSIRFKIYDCLIFIKMQSKLSLQIFLKPGDFQYPYQYL